jgi:hypothetical protein
MTATKMRPMDETGMGCIPYIDRVIAWRLREFLHDHISPIVDPEDRAEFARFMRQDIQDGLEMQEGETRSRVFPFDEAIIGWVYIGAEIEKWMKTLVNPTSAPSVSRYLMQVLDNIADGTPIADCISD